MEVGQDVFAGEGEGKGLSFLWLIGAIDCDGLFLGVDQPSEFDAAVDIFLHFVLEHGEAIGVGV